MSDTNGSDTNGYINIITTNENNILCTTSWAMV